MDIRLALASSLYIEDDIPWKSELNIPFLAIKTISIPSIIGMELADSFNLLLYLFLTVAPPILFETIKPNRDPLYPPGAA